MPNPGKLSRKQTEYLNARPVGRYAQLGRDGAVFVTPLCHVVSAGNVFISTERGTWKVRSLKPGSVAAYVVDEYFDDWDQNRGVQVRGPVEIVEGGPEYRRAKRLHLMKFPQFETFEWDDKETVVLKILPERVTAWGLDRWERGAWPGA